VRSFAVWVLLVAGGALAACGGDDETTVPAGGSAGTTSSAGGAGATGASGGADSGGGGSSHGGAGQGGEGGVAPTALVHRSGRFDDSDAAGAQFTWSGSSFQTRIDGTALDVELDGASDVWFEIVVDGASVGHFTTSGGPQTYPLVSGLPAGPHDVQLFRRNEGFFGVVQFLGFTPGADTTQVESPSPYLHRIELIGDSLTAGYGIEGADQYCNFSADTENAYLTYGAVAARNVQADPHIIAYSGIGVYQDYGGGTSEQMPERFLRTFADSATPAWDFASWVPEAVVVNLGTNDNSSDVAEANFVGAYTAFLGTLRGYYPNAAIFCVSWANWGATSEGWVDQAVAATADANTYRLSFVIDPADGLGCDWHTNVVTNGKLAEQLTDAFATELGW
jgi:lysophospholipase L1-like esterase